MSTLFVTVGSTRFDTLIAKVTSDDFLNRIKQAGFGKLILQAGSSEITSYNSHDLDIEIYKYKSDIIHDARKADLVISHAGAGTCLEMLRLNKKLLIVVNEKLMDNHQAELAEQLGKERYAMMSMLDKMEENFYEIIKKDLSMRKFPKPSSKFGEILNTHLEHLSI